MDAGELAARRVEGEWPCDGCGYNLRGLSADGRCPECGHAVADSLRATSLFHADPRWLRRLAVAGVLPLAAVVFVVVFEIVEGSLKQWLLAGGAFYYVNAAGFFAGQLLLAAGPALLLFRPPRRYDARPARRRLGLAAPALHVVVTLAMVVLLLVNASLPVSPSGMSSGYANASIAAAVSPRDTVDRRPNGVGAAR